MSIPYFAKQIQPGEKIKKVIYQSPWYYFFKIIISIAFIWAPLFFYFWLEQKIGQAASWLVLFLVFWGIFILINTIMKLKYTAWVVTNERLLDFDQKNFWYNEMNESSLEELAKPQMVKNGWKSIVFGLRTLRLFLIEEKAYLEIAGIKKDKNLLDFFKKVLAENYINYKE